MLCGSPTPTHRWSKADVNARCLDGDEACLVARYVNDQTGDLVWPGVVANRDHATTFLWYRNRQRELAYQPFPVRHITANRRRKVHYRAARD